MRLKGLLSTAASRAWTGVALVGLVIVVGVFALMLAARLGAGQDVVDGAGPAFTDTRVEGTRAGVDELSRYVDVADPLLTARGGGNKEVRSLVRLVRRRLDLSSAQVRKIMRREAPHLEALTHALPLERIGDEIALLTAYLATTLTMTEDQLAAALEQSFPNIAQALTALPNVADAWYDVPGIEGLTRLSRDKPVRTLPGLRKYYRDDVVPLVVARRKDFQRLAGTGGIGYVPYLLLAFGLGLLVYGLLQARRAERRVPGKLSWSVVVAAGVFLLAFVLAAQLLPRLGAGQRVVTAFEPVFAADRVTGAVNGVDAVHEAVELGDPIMTRAGGAAREVPRLYRFVAQRTGRRASDVRRALEARAPRTVALLAAIPLSQVAREVPRFVAYLAKALRVRPSRVESMLRRRTPRLARALLGLPAVAVGWNAVDRDTGLRRFDGIAPVRTMPEFADYLREDLVPVLPRERAHFRELASRWPPLDRLAPILLLAGVFVLLYGGLMMQLVARRY